LVFEYLTTSVCPDLSLRGVTMKENTVDRPCAKSEFSLTIIDNAYLMQRLTVEMSFSKRELEHAWRELRKDPIGVGLRIWRECVDRSNSLLQTPNLLRAFATATLIVASIVLSVFIIDRRATERTQGLANEVAAAETVMLTLTKPSDSTHDTSVGRDGTGRVGINREKGEGSGAEQKRSRGGGTGGNNNLSPPQQGKLPPPSSIQAAIPTTPPPKPPTLPVAGIEIDPALWKDLKTPSYGDPRSTTEVRSHGPGDGGGIGINQGLGIGEGSGPGFGPGKDGNTGGDKRQTGCCGDSGARDNSTGANRIWRGPEVERRARLLSKPEPQYTEEARRNQITGTVMLRVVFSSMGEVTQIRAVQSLPFGLTERAIAAARLIRFAPATKGGRPVSVFMQLEYNFNLY
jgi:TonB family protein